MDAETFEKYKITRDEAWPLLDKISSMAQMVSIAIRTPNAQSEIDVAAVGLICEMISDDIQKIHAIFNHYLGNPYESDEAKT